MLYYVLKPGGAPVETGRKGKAYLHSQILSVFLKSGEEVVRQGVTL